MFSLFNKAKGKDGLVGIYFSADSVTLAHIVSPDSDPELKLCEEFKAETLEDKAKVLEKQVNKLGLEDTKASFILSPTDYKLFLVESPQVEPEEMTGAVKWKIKDLISQPVDEMAITIFPVPDDAYRGQSDMVYAVAAKKSKIHEIIDLVNNSGLVLKTIDIPELVMKNLTAVSADDSNGLAILDLRGTGSILNLSKKGAIYLTRHLNTRMDAEVMRSGDWESILEKLVLEIQRSLDYYESQMGQSPIAKILVAPRESDSAALALQLNDAMAVSVGTLDLTNSLKSKLDLPMNLQQACMMAIGGALRQEKAA